MIKPLHITMDYIVRVLDYYFFQLQSYFRFNPSYNWWIFCEIPILAHCSISLQLLIRLNSVLTNCTNKKMSDRNTRGKSTYFSVHDLHECGYLFPTGTSAIIKTQLVSSKWFFKTVSMLTLSNLSRYTYFMSQLRNTYTSNFQHHDLIS